MIHYIGVTSMAKPHIHVPPQHPSPRKVQKGDVVFCELSAYWWDYPGQVLRTFTVGADATPLYRDLHQAAEAAFDAVTAVVRHGTKMQEIIDAANVIEASGFTVCDDLMHGFGGGYLQPILGSGSRPAGPLPDMRLEENMTVVVQPNVTTREEKAKAARRRAGRGADPGHAGRLRAAAPREAGALPGRVATLIVITMNRDGHSPVCSLPAQREGWPVPRPSVTGTPASPSARR